MLRFYILTFIFTFATHIVAQDNFTSPNYKKYQAYLNKLGNNLEDLDRATYKYQELFNNSDIKERDNAIKLFFDKYEKIIDNLSNEIYQNNFDIDQDALYDYIYNNDDNSKKITTKELYFYKKLQQYSLTFDLSEGIGYIRFSDNKYFKNNFNSLISKDLFDYYNFLIYCNVNYAAEDAGLMISTEELADRLATWEKIYYNNIPNYAKTVAKDKVLSYFSVLLTGLDNTPAFDYDTRKISSDFLASYKYFINKYPNSKATNLFKEYLNILEKNNFTETDAVINSSSKLENKLKNLLH